LYSFCGYFFAIQWFTHFLAVFAVSWVIGFWSNTTVGNFAPRAAFCRGALFFAATLQFFHDCARMFAIIFYFCSRH